MPGSVSSPKRAGMVEPPARVVIGFLTQGLARRTRTQTGACPDGVGLRCGYRNDTSTVDRTRKLASAKARRGLVALTVAAGLAVAHATRVRVFGFTDSLGTTTHGVALSKRRADAVQAVLDQDLNTPSITFDVRGYGEQYPIADNSTEAGRKKNRRVEVSFPRTRQ